ncbi:PrsW family intramembrane metalloprotease [Patescibacteria group bacterium]
MIIDVIWYIFIGFLPGLFWLWFYYKKDLHPEPLKWILKVFLWGMLMTIPAIVIEVLADSFLQVFIDPATLSYIFMTTFVIVAPVEEFLKYLVVKRVVFDKPVFDEKIDGVVYCIAAGLGFATFENILAAIGSGEEIVLARAVTATLLHATASGLVGFYLGQAKFRPKKRKYYIAIGLTLGIAVHGLYNFVITLDTALTIPLIIVLLAVVYVILAVGIRRMRRVEV